eukprot:13094011-Ditylum_brightwellii.AAC.1
MSLPNASPTLSTTQSTSTFSISDVFDDLEPAPIPNYGQDLLPLQLHMEHYPQQTTIKIKPNGENYKVEHQMQCISLWKAQVAIHHGYDA